MHRLILAFLFVVCLVSCKSSDVLRADPYPATMDVDVYQTRLEFKGCGIESVVGSIVCYPTDKEVKIRTEFPGFVTLLSKGEGCLRHEEFQATAPYTVIPLSGTVDRSCSTTILYQPKFIEEPDMEIRGVFGELIQFNEASIFYMGSRSFDLFSPVKLTLPQNVVRGWYINRFTSKPLEFKGNTISYSAPTIDTDLLQIKAFDAQGNAVFYLYTLNYYSQKAKNLSVSLVPADSGKVTVVLPDEVTVVSIEGRMEFWRSFKMSKSFVGIIRAYTVKGRTLVFRLNKGKIEWKQ